MTLELIQVRELTPVEVDVGLDAANMASLAVLMDRSPGPRLRDELSPALRIRRQPEMTAQVVVPVAEELAPEVTRVDDRVVARPLDTALDPGLDVTPSTKPRERTGEVRDLDVDHRTQVSGTIEADLASVVVMDVELLRARTPRSRMDKVVAPDDHPGLASRVDSRLGGSLVDQISLVHLDEGKLLSGLRNLVPVDAAVVVRDVDSLDHFTFPSCSCRLNDESRRRSAGRSGVQRSRRPSDDGPSERPGPRPRPS